MAKTTYSREELEQQLSESRREFRAADATIYTAVSEDLSPPIQGDGFCVDMVRYSDYASLEARCAALAAENAALKDFVKTCFRASADGASLDGADIQELGERLGLFGLETYQPALHGYICGHEAGEDTVYVMKKTPATDAFLAEVRAQGVEMFGQYHNFSEKLFIQKEAKKFAAQLRQEAAQ